MLRAEGKQQVLYPMVDPEKSQVAQRRAEVLHQWQQSCRAFTIVFIPHPSTLRLPIQPIQQNEGKEGGSVLMVLAWFLLLSRLLPAIQSRMVSSVWDNLFHYRWRYKGHSTKYFKKKHHHHHSPPRAGWNL